MSKDCGKANDILILSKELIVKEKGEQQKTEEKEEAGDISEVSSKSPLQYQLRTDELA